MAGMKSDTRRALDGALRARRYDDADRILAQLADQASCALAAGQMDELASARGRISRLRRAACAADSQWSGIEEMRSLDRALGSAVVALHLAWRRQQSPPIPERVAAALAPAP